MGTFIGSSLQLNGTAEIAGALTANTVIVGNTDVQTLIDTAADQAYANATSEASGTFDTLGTMSTQDAANVNIGGGLIDNTEIGLTTPNDAAFVNASANNISSNNLSVAGIAHPTSDGTNGQVMTTNGSGSLTFADAAGGGEFTLTSSNGTIHSSEAGTGGISTSNFFVGSGAGHCASNTGAYFNLSGLPGETNSACMFNNIFIGRNAGYNSIGVCTSCYGGIAAASRSNNFFGSNAGSCNTFGSFNNFFGSNAGSCNTFGNYNNFFGSNAGCSNTIGCFNNFFGVNAGCSNVHGGNNNFLGRCAGLCSTTGSLNNFFGQVAGCSNTSGSNNNFFGNVAGRLNTTGGNNNFLGRYAGNSNTTGCYNNFFGNIAGRSNTIGCFNNFFGVNAGCSNTMGDNNNFLGRCAGRLNTTGGNNIAIGQHAGWAGFFVNPSGLFNLTTESNRIIMGNCSHSCAQIQIGWTTVSDVRDKCIYGSIDRGLGFLKGINPIEYQFKDRKNDEITDPIKKRRYGFSAQEILELEGDHPVIVSDEDPDKLQITTDHLLPIMVNAIKELSAKCEALEERVAILEQ